MKSYFLIVIKVTIIVLTLSTVAIAQEGNLKFGPQLKGAKQIVHAKLVDNSLAVITSNGNELSAWKLSPVSLMPTGEPKPITSSKKNLISGNVVSSNENEFYRFFNLDKKNMLFYTNRIVEKGTTSLLYQSTDNTGKPLEKPIKLASRSNKLANTGFLNMVTVDGGGYSLMLNRTKSSLLIVNQAPSTKVDKEIVPGEISLSLYDTETMKDIANANYKLDISDYGTSAVLGENGYVYSLVKVSLTDKKDKKEKKKSGDATWYYKIVGVNLNKPYDAPIESNFDFKNKGILGAALEFAPTGELICAGTYSELTTKGNIDDFDGIFYAKINPTTGEVVSENNRKLDRKTVEFMTSKRNAHRDEGVSSAFGIKGFVSLENGSSDLILEETYMFVETSYNGRTYTTTYHYVSKAILVANIDTNGEIVWINHIPKHQHTTNDNGMFNSCTYFKDKNTLKFVFADNNNNYDPITFNIKPNNAKNINSMAVSAAGKSIAYAKVDENGKVEQKLVATAKKHLLLTKNGIWSKSGEELYIPAKTRISAGKWILGCLFPPYGCVLWYKNARPNYAVGRLELN